MTITEDWLIDQLKAGVKIRWIPKSVIYNEVIGEDYRYLYIGKKQLSSGDAYSCYVCLRSLKIKGMVRFRETKSGIGYCELVAT